MKASARAREILLLCVGLGSAATLALAALFALRPDPAAGEILAARLAGEIADTVRAEWQRWLSLDEFPVAPASRKWHWQAPAAPHVLESRDVLASEDPDRPSPLALFLRAADELELAGRTSEALERLREGLERNPQGALRAEVFLRAMQLARRSQDTDHLRRTWQQASAEVGPEATREGIAYHALYLLAVAGVLEEPERENALNALAEARDLGTLRLPAAGTRAIKSEDGQIELLEDPLRVALRRNLSELVAAEKGLAWTRADTAHHELECLAAFLGGIPSVPQAEGWRVQATPVEFFAAHALVVGTLEGFFVTRQGLALAMQSSLALPEDFLLDFGQEEGMAGVVVRAETQLGERGPSFRVRHTEPALLGQAEAGRVALLRTALCLLALLGALATLFGARASARERRLASLKEAFIANVSHDLRTPLASILLMAENLENGRIDAERARSHYYPALRREAARLRHLVEDVLDFSRLQRGEGTHLLRESVDLAHFAEELRREFAELVHRAGKDFAFAAEGFVGAAEIDAFALRRALGNLIDNALQHSGSTRIELNLAAANGQLYLRVGDEGLGIPTADQERIFEPYERGGSSVGNGLGLAIVRQIALAHGGAVHLRTNSGERGAVFELALPWEQPLQGSDAGASR